MRSSRLAVAIGAVVVMISATMTATAPRVVADDAGGPTVIEPCSHATQAGWLVGNDAAKYAGLSIAMFGGVRAFGRIFTGLGSLGKVISVGVLTVMAVSASETARRFSCQASQGIEPTLGLLAQELSLITRTELDRELILDDSADAASIAQRFAERMPILEEWLAGEADGAVTANLRTDLMDIADDATLLLDRIDRRSWLATPLVIPLAWLASRGYLFAAQIFSPESAYRTQNLTWAGDAFDRIAPMLQKKEDAFRTDLSGLTVRRFAKHEHQFALWDKYTTETSVARANGVVEHSFERICDEQATLSYGCDAEFAETRPKQFDKAWRKYAEVRASLIGAFDAAYLADKAAFGYQAAFNDGDGEDNDAAYGAQAFHLVNNRSNAEVSRCLGVARDEPSYDDCDFGTDEAGAAQLWSYVPGTALLRHVSSGRCLEGPAVVPATGAARVALVECPEAVTDPLEGDLDGPGDVLDRRLWGINPAGYLVHLASGGCLGSGVRMAVAPCEYGTPSRRGGLDAPPGADEWEGVSPPLGEFPDAGDPITHQVWHVRAAPTIPVEVELPDSASAVRVTSYPTGLIDCGASHEICSADIAIGAELELRATTSEPGQSPVWTGGCRFEGTTCVITARAPLSARTNEVTVSSADLRFVEVPASDLGTVEVVAAIGQPAATECAAAGCVYRFRAGTEAVLRALPGARQHVSGWTGPCAAVVGSVCRLTLGAPGVPGHRVSAIFDPDRPPSIAISAQRGPIRPGRSVMIRVLVTTTDDVAPTGRIRVSFAGTDGTTRLDSRGQGSVRLRVPSTTRAGTHRVRVAYLGDDRTLRGRATTRIAVVR